MSSTEQAREFIQNWVNAETNPRFGVLIEGSWGAGKTHFIKSVLEDESFTSRKMVYVSLFGVNSIKDLETTLFFASANTTQKVFHRGASVMSSLVKGALRIDINDDGKDDGSINTDFKGLNDFVEKISDTLAKSFIVLDDLERCAIPMSKLLGFCNQFIEHQDARFLFVANTDKLKGRRKKDFSSFKEKVIGHSFKLKAKPEEALSVFISEIESPEVRVVLNVLADQIIELFEKSTYQNLRALRQFVWHYSRLLNAMKPEFLESMFLMSNLTEQYFVFFTEFKLDLGGYELTLTDLKSDMSNSEDSVVYATAPLKDKKNSPKYDVLSKYSGGYDTVLPVSVWIELFETGVVVSEPLNQCFSKSKYMSLGVPAWQKLWEFQTREDEDVENAISTLLRQFDQREVTDAGEILHMFALRFLMSELEIIEDDFETVEKSCEKYISDLLFLGTLPPRPTNWRWPNSRRYDFSYNKSYFVRDSYKTRFNKLREYFDNARVKSFISQGANIAQEIIQALKKDPDEFSNLVSYKYGKGKYASVSVLQHVDVSEFLDSWLSLPTSYWLDVHHAINARYETGGLSEGENLEGEKDWALSLQKLMKARAAELGGFRGLRISRIIPNLVFNSS